MIEEGLLKKTMTTVAAMLGAWFVLIGLLSVLTAFVIGKIASPTTVENATVPAAGAAAVDKNIPPAHPASGMRPIKSAISPKSPTEI